MRAFKNLNCSAAIVSSDNIDTDRIIPARFLTTTSAQGLGAHLFADWPPGQEAVQHAEMLVAGHNFGCGSSREHAVWALLDAGIRVVVSTGFADIFHSNALRNGLVLIALDPSAFHKLVNELKTNPSAPVAVDLEDQRLRCGTFEVGFEFDAFAQYCITRGLDEISYLLEQLPAIDAYEADHLPRVSTRGEES